MQEKIDSRGAPVPVAGAGAGAGAVFEGRDTDSVDSSKTGSAWSDPEATALPWAGMPPPDGGRFVCTELLATGGGGTVWLARRHDETEVRFVLKAALPGLESGLHAEWRALHDVPSPVLPEPIAFLPAGPDGPAALVMVRRAGLTLDRALADATPRRVATVVQAVLRGLQALHAAGLVHGDLHPGNVLVQAGEPTQVSLLDLGLAVAPGTRSLGPGRLPFAAPDAMRGQPADPRDDLFSLAMAVWLAWRVPLPFAHYPAVLPERTALPAVPRTDDPARDAVLQALARWLAPAREHRPDDAAQALRQWTATLRLESAEAEALSHDLMALAHRPWRWGRWPGVPALAVPVTGQVQTLTGPAGIGRTGALLALAEAAHDRGARVAWLRPEGADPLASAWLELRLPVPDDAAAAPSGPAILADAAGAEVVRQGLRLQRLCRTLGADGLLLADDADALPVALQRALYAVDSGDAARVVAAADSPLPGAVVLPAAEAAEIDAALHAASGGRAWDAGLVASIAARATSRREIFACAGACLQAGMVDVTADRVALRPGLDAATELGLLLEARARPVLPDPALWPLAAKVAVADRNVVAAEITPDIAASLRQTALLRVVGRGQVTTADATARAFLLRELPVAILATAARLRAHGMAATDPERVALEVSAAGWDGGNGPKGEQVQAAAQTWLAQGEAARAVELCRNWLPTAAQAEAHLVLAVYLRALVARGQFEAGEAVLAALSPTQRSEPQLQLAEAELAFRRGDYPRCRRLAEATLEHEATAADARVWLAFAATWQGDREAAARAVASGQAQTHDSTRLHLFQYLAGLGDYYAGRLDQAQAAFAALAPVASGSLRAATEGGLGLVAHRRGDLQAARQHYDRARKLAETAGDLPRALNMAMNAAVLDHERGDLGLALDGYDRVVAVARRLDDAGALARALNNRGNLLALIGDDETARQDLSEALTAMERAGNAYLAGNVRCLLAELDRRTGRLAEARGQLDLADAAVQGSGASEHLEICLERGQLQLASGDVQAARTTALAVRVAAARLGSPENEARGLWLLARTRLDALPVPDPEGLREAVDHLAAALQLAPASKALLHVELQADRARTAAWTGDGATARTAAREALARLSAVAATLGPARQQAFQHAAVLAPTRAILRILAHLPDQGRGAGLQPLAGAGALHAVLTINRRLSGEYDLPHLLEIVMDSAVLLTGAERGFLLIDDDEPDEKPHARKPAAHRLRVAVARNLDRENLRKASHKLSHGIALRVFEGGEPVLSTDAQQDERFADQASIHSGSLRSILCVPLSWQGRPIGVVYVDNRFTTGAFSADHAGVLEALADQAAIAIQTARLLQRQRETTEALARSRAEVEQLNAQLRERLAETEHALDDARADLQAQRLALARRSDFSVIKGESPNLHRLFALMERVRDHDFPVLVRGESGTGKELVARAIHFTGRRKKGPFVAVNCAALPANLLESELFGHVRGAFTGAVAERRGLFESAHGGTLLLDEVGEMPLEMQAKLLRVLQSGEIQRVGDSAVRKVDTRVVAATHRDLQAMVAQGTFREDLMYRLRVVELEVPPLRKRQDDIPLLVEHFLQENRTAGVGRIERVAPAALQRLRQYPWPGNVRQLETVLKSACLFAPGTVLEAADVDPLLQRERPLEPRPEEPESSVAKPTWWATAPLEDVITRVVQARVTACGGNKRRAAETLGIDRGTLYNRLKLDV